MIAVIGCVLTITTMKNVFVQTTENVLHQMFVNVKLAGLVLIVEKKPAKEGVYTAFVTT